VRVAYFRFVGDNGQSMVCVDKDTCKPLNPMVQVHYENLRPLESADKVKKSGTVAGLATTELILYWPQETGNEQKQHR
jgi:hypothetical protein